MSPMDFCPDSPYGILRRRMNTHNRIFDSAEFELRKQQVPSRCCAKHLMRHNEEQRRAFFDSAEYELRRQDSQTRSFGLPCPSSTSPSEPIALPKPQEQRPASNGQGPWAAELVAHNRERQFHLWDSAEFVLQRSNSRNHDPETRCSERDYNWAPQRHLLSSL